MQEERQPSQQVAIENEDNAGMSDGARVTASARLMRSRGARLAAFAALVIALSAGVSALVAKAVQPDYVVFDMKGTIDTFRQQTAQQPVEKGALETLTKRFGAALDASLSDWQAAHGGVILVKGAVVAGVTDITPVIQADIARQMQGAQ
ncbi:MULTISPECIES: type-F conjugative transfer system protein TrbI [Pantoea]|jgi:conjugal transfer pilin signal peptidase TrbI|uniref:type-F conjugative transfer system protein TrbI n=1 Tax=Pantoea TaxID=53335 RepID=UPI00104C394E|nr:MULTISPECIES: type-F conjugative transfer system protein TrbI [Pantoea]KAF6672749.1 type-F conjugative transfer system protein TrbI [Pantoea sp. EKM21T]KAF6677937.1 type-F conjugative transfer system protein TrbI [Pantoea sp. EKM22T]MBD8133179.1 type-F conjugative transfer system protein TrbI [Pantoea agglomerans]TCZ22303.1 type-F conjugative transfer system protein TrbI [Pantoea agglomerans]TKK16139.1 type-F conjugative transfer system protein TrbI [Pantoea agglomerans]